MSAAIKITSRSGLVSVNAENFVPDAYALQLLTESVAREHQCLPLNCSLPKRLLHVCTANKPTSRQRRRILATVNEQSNCSTPWRVQWHTANSGDIQWGINCAYSATHDLEKISSECATQAKENAVTFANEHWPVVRWFDALLNDAVHRRASDIHLLVQNSCLLVRYRIDGQMVNRLSLVLDVWPALTARIKNLANLDVTEHRRPQDGSLERCIQQSVQPVRVAIMPHLNTEKITLRLLQPASALPTLAQVLVHNDVLKTVQEALHSRSGLIVVAGPTGSGKTTTLYACVQAWLRAGMSLITLEDPVEVTLSGVCQSEICTNLGFNFADGLRSALRHDPDGLLVGEVRDTDSCRLTLRAALTGHPVLTTVHASDAVGVFQRLLELDAPVSLLADTVQLVLVQRLLRKPCVCLGERSGCEHCWGSGYRDRVAAIDAFVPDANFFALLQQNHRSTQTFQSAAWQHARVQARQRLDTAVYRLWQVGIVDLSERNKALNTAGGKDAKFSNTRS